MYTAIKNLLKNDSRFLIGFCFLCIVIFLAFLSFLNPNDPRAYGVFARDLSPSWKNILGTNSLGQDIFWGVTEAIKNTLILGIIATILSRIIAIVVGLSAGYMGGIIDRILSTFMDSFIDIPLLLILISSLLRESMTLSLLAIILAIFGWSWSARMFRSYILSLKTREFTRTAIYSGMSTFKIIKHEYLPFIMPLILATSINSMIYFIGMEVTLSILGLASIEQLTLGMMIRGALEYQAFLLGLWNWILPPIVILIFLIIGMYLIAVSISDYLDPRVRVQKIKLGEGVRE
jgi:peptide/nickel transport system permease protein